MPKRTYNDNGFTLSVETNHGNNEVKIEITRDNAVEVIQLKTWQVKQLVQLLTADWQHPYN